MPFKLNISEKGKAYKLELQEESLVGKSVGDKFTGSDISHDFEGYELEITGGSDLAGFPLHKGTEGIALRRILLTKGWGMRKKGPGLRLKKTIRGKVISVTTAQINIKVLKSGKKSLAEIFPDQNKATEADAPKAESPAPEAEAPVVA
ncbi:30S ribosomal protein S6e [Candidatus Pacearchaeota archaeon CG10_big_fil_rev_8_21_14_0_10_31_24]|nr:MAG: 30S ribosomal protein S6e [Candidatus Pacearchaeota archaeon CG10_big_fil_rev_8_21_14_0_10_31_24]